MSLECMPLITPHISLRVAQAGILCPLTVGPLSHPQCFMPPPASRSRQAEARSVGGSDSDEKEDGGGRWGRRVTILGANGSFEPLSRLPQGLSRARLGVPVIWRVRKSPLHEHTQASDMRQGSMPCVVSASIYVSCLPQSLGDFSPV